MEGFEEEFVFGECLDVFIFMGICIGEVKKWFFLIFWFLFFFLNKNLVFCFVFINFVNIWLFVCELIVWFVLLVEEF